MEQHRDLTALLPQEITVLVIGDVCLDEYLHGSVSRVALDCPVPVFSASGSRFYPGQASNVAQNIANLGEHFGIYLLGVVGNDDKGTQLRDLVSASPRIAPFLYRISGRPTCHKCRVVAQGNHQVLRIDNETAAPIPRKAEEALLKEFRSTLPHVQGVICSDNTKGCLTPRLLQGVITAARGAGVPVIVDPKGQDADRFHGSTIIKPNRRELGLLTNMPVEKAEDIELAAGELLRRTGAQAVVVTLGDKGCEVHCQGRPVRRIPAHTVTSNELDVSGAGDTFLAAFSLAIFNNGTPVEAAKIGTVASGLVVRKYGTATVTREELLNSLTNTRHSRRIGTAAAKLLSLDQLMQVLAPIRGNGSHVVFTNGCFDLLHAGHVQFLEYAKELGDVLVVGLNTDSSIVQTKGSGRPVICEEQRVRMLSALSCVNFIVLFSEPAPTSLIETILPDVLVKGDDYTLDQVVGAEVVKAAGGRVGLVQRIEGLSTTSIIRRIVQRNGTVE